MKKITKEIPFYGNTKDRTHCFQACLKMALGCFCPEQKFSFKELDRISQKEEGKWTWPMAALAWLAENGFEVVYVVYKETFDYEKFAIKGREYIDERYGEEIGEETEKNSNIKQGQKQSDDFLRKVDVRQEVPGKQDVFDFINEGYVVVALLNARVLNGGDGYAGHFVVVKGWDDENFILNDPSFPGVENREVAEEEFMKAWSYAGEENRNLIAVRLKARFLPAQE